MRFFRKHKTDPTINQNPVANYLKTDFVVINSFSELNMSLKDALLEEKILGVLVKKFLNNNEVNTLLSNLEMMDISKKTIFNEGFSSYPLTFSQFIQALDKGIMTENEYLKIAENFNLNFVNEFGVNIENKLISFLKLFLQSDNVRTIFDPKSNKKIIPYTFRELRPKSGELIIHCENLFFHEFPSFFNWLKKLNVRENKFSFFITLKNSEIGGNLCCYDLSWQNIKKRITPFELMSDKGERINILDEGIKITRIKPEVGDLLLFAGGNVWHRVENTENDVGRTTLGGFVATTKYKNEYILWS